MGKEISRRAFLKTGTAAAIGLSMMPDKVFAGDKQAPPPLKRKLKILGVGIGGRGASVLRGLETEEITDRKDLEKLAEKLAQKAEKALGKYFN